MKAETEIPLRISDRQDLLEMELATLYQVSQMLSRSLNLELTIREVLTMLHEKNVFLHGMVSLLDSDTGETTIRVVVSGDSDHPVSYRQGEGIVGMIMQRGETVVVPKVSDEPRFLHKRGICDMNLPFIGVPLFGGEDVIGVVAAQPPEGGALLEEWRRFLEMIATLFAQTVRLCRRFESRQSELRDERDKLRRAVKNQHGFDQIVGHAPAMREIFEQVRLVSKWDTTVLIRGESGTGKELIASAIHYNSPRHAGAFIKLNCAALPDTLLESELFGHEKGAFTGATVQRKGRFEQADGGTLFLDEIGEITPTFQAKLLRVLQEGEFERIGGMKTLKVDVRVIAATNRDLEADVESGAFREDLYYRLNVMPITLPALRDRVEDVPDLAAFLVAKVAAKQSRELSITDSAIRLLMRHDWPGNVRELENYIERAAILCETGAIDRDVIELSGLRESGLHRAPIPPTQVPTETPRFDPHDPDLDEREQVIAALEEAGWVQAKAARLLDMTPRQIAYRIKTLNIKMRQI
ncbi:sigma-54-dependent Fis family transcriptional regulator [Magnetospira thiophila]